MRNDRLSFGIVFWALATASVCGARPIEALAARERAQTSHPDDSNKPGVRKSDLPFAGQLSSLFKIKNDDPESSVPTANQRDGNPVEFGYYLQDLLAKSQAATKRGDRRANVRYLRALAISIPDQAKGWSLLCEAYEKDGERERAIGACKYAIDREGVEIKDFARFVHLIALKETDLDDDERTALNAVLAHLDKDPSLTVPTAQMRCEAAVKMKDRQAMEACTAVLAKAAPDDPKTIVFQWSLAMMRGQRDDASELVARAKAAGLAIDAVERMNNLMAQTRWSPHRLVGVGALAAALVLAFLILRRRLETRRLVTGVASPPLPRG